MKHLIVLLPLFVAGCCAHVDNPTVEPTCADACARLTALGCEGAKPTPSGATCQQVCENAQSSGIITWDLKCVTEAGCCDAADACGGEK